MSEYSFHISMLETAGMLYRERGLENIIDNQATIAGGVDQNFK